MMVSRVFGKMLKLLRHKCFAIGAILIVVNIQLLEYIIVIWWH